MFAELFTHVIHSEVYATRKIQLCMRDYVAGIVGGRLHPDAFSASKMVCNSVHSNAKTGVLDSCECHTTNELNETHSVNAPADDG